MKADLFEKWETHKLVSYDQSWGKAASDEAKVQMVLLFHLYNIDLCPTCTTDYHNNSAKRPANC